MRGEPEKEEVSLQEEMEKLERLFAGDLEGEEAPLGGELSSLQDEIGQGLRNRKHPVAWKVAYLRAKGMNRKQIVEFLQGFVSYAQLTKLEGQKWFQEMVLEEVERQNEDLEETLFKAEVLPSLEALKAVRDSAKSAPSAKVAAANSLLDRALGKSVARVATQSQLTIDRAKTDLDELERAIQSLEEQSKRGFN